MSEIVYFISDTNGLVKIGYTANLKRRLAQFSSMNGGLVLLLGTVEGNRRHERALHRLLSDHRVRGEWFTDTPKLRALMRRVLDKGFEGIDVEPEKAVNVSGAFSEAIELANIILDAAGIKNPTREFGVSLGLRESLLWTLKYRPSHMKDIGVSDYLSLIAAAKKATQDRIDELVQLSSYADRLKIRWDILDRQTTEATITFEAARREWGRQNPGKDVWKFIQANNAAEADAVASAEAFLNEMDAEDLK